MATDTAFLSRPNLRSLASDESDECVADLQYRDTGEFVVEHNVATQAFVDANECRRVRTDWIPKAEVEHVASNDISGAACEHLPKVARAGGPGAFIEHSLP